MWTGTYDKNFHPKTHRECRECSDNMMCHTGGMWSSWCWGKDPSLRFYDHSYPFTAPKASNSVPTGNPILYSTGPLMRNDDKRVAFKHRNGCMDCNAVEYSSGICTFASDYFPDHSFTRDATWIVKCPF